MSTRIIRSTSKGQITLPSSWRKKFKTDHFILDISEGSLCVKPIELDSMNDEVIFDSERDNHGRGVSVHEMITLLKKMKNE